MADEIVVVGHRTELTQSERHALWSMYYNDTFVYARHVSEDGGGGGGEIVLANHTSVATVGDGFAELRGDLVLRDVNGNVVVPDVDQFYDPSIPGDPLYDTYTGSDNNNNGMPDRIEGAIIYDSFGSVVGAVTDFGFVFSPGFGLFD